MPVPVNKLSDDEAAALLAVSTRGGSWTGRHRTSARHYSPRAPTCVRFPRCTGRWSATGRSGIVACSPTRPPRSVLGLQATGP